MRYFNTHGPVNEKEHYVVPRSELISDLVAQIVALGQASLLKSRKSTDMSLS